MEATYFSTTLLSRVYGGDVLLHDVIITRLWRRRTFPRRYYHASMEATSYHASDLANVLITHLWRRHLITRLLRRRTLLKRKNTRLSTSAVKDGTLHSPYHSLQVCASSHAARPGCYSAPPLSHTHSRREPGEGRRLRDGEC